MNPELLLPTNRQLSLLIGVLLVITAFASQVSDPIKLVVEPNHSTVGFSVPISNGLTRITGKFTEYAIDINYVDHDITQSTVSATINVASINTGIPSRDDHLKTEDFFETDKYPHATFESDSIRKTKDGFIAYGKLFLHGITKNIELPFRITGMDGNDVIGFSSRYVLKRNDFAVGTEFKHTTEDNFIGNDIGIEIDFWTKKPKEK